MRKIKDILEAIIDFFGIIIFTITLPLQLIYDFIYFDILRPLGIVKYDDSPSDGELDLFPNRRY